MILFKKNEAYRYFLNGDENVLEVWDVVHKIKTGRLKTKCLSLNACVLYIVVDKTDDVQHHHVHFNITLPIGTCLHCSVCFIPLHTGLPDFFKNKCILLVL